MTGQGSQVLLRLRESGVMKTVGLISDTHIPVRAKEIPQRVFEIFENVDFIIHAGDFVNISVFDELERFAPVLAVYGNMDGPKIRGKLPKMDSSKVFGWKIGVMHNPRALFGMSKMREIAQESNFDVFVYGHTHNPKMTWEGNILFINPGSPTNPMPPFVTKPSVALLKMTEEKITPEIISI